MFLWWCIPTLQAAWLLKFKKLSLEEKKKEEELLISEILIPLVSVQQHLGSSGNNIFTPTEKLDLRMLN